MEGGSKDGTKAIIGSALIAVHLCRPVVYIHELCVQRSMCNTMQVSISVSDINDNSPVFQVDFVNLTLSESLPLLTPVLNLVATDNDFGANGAINYTILYQISETSGRITEGTCCGVFCSLLFKTLPSFRVFLSSG